MANAEHKPGLVYTAIGSLLARYIRFVDRTSRQDNGMTERFDAHSHTTLHLPCGTAVMCAWSTAGFETRSCAASDAS